MRYFVCILPLVLLFAAPAGAAEKAPLSIPLERTVKDAARTGKFYTKAPAAKNDPRKMARLRPAKKKVFTGPRLTHPSRFDYSSDANIFDFKINGLNDSRLSCHAKNYTNGSARRNCEKDYVRKMEQLMAAYDTKLDPKNAQNANIDRVNDPATDAANVETATAAPSPDVTMDAPVKEKGPGPVPPAKFSGAKTGAVKAGISKDAVGPIGTF